MGRSCSLLCLKICAFGICYFTATLEACINGFARFVNEKLFYLAGYEVVSNYQCFLSVYTV